MRRAAARYVAAVCVVVVLCLSAASALADGLQLDWRTPFGTPRAVAVNPTDGSCWATTGNCVMHLAADGTVLSQVTVRARCLSIPPMAPAGSSTTGVARRPTSQPMVQSCGGETMPPPRVRSQ